MLPTEIAYYLLSYVAFWSRTCDYMKSIHLVKQILVQLQPYSCKHRLQIGLSGMHTNFKSLDCQLV